MKFNIPEEHAKSSGIYIIRNSINKRVYVGSTIYLKKRFLQHKYSVLKPGVRGNKRLQNFAKKYGAQHLIFELLELCDIEELSEKEQKWIDYYNSYNQKTGFNIIPSAYTMYVRKKEVRELLYIVKACPCCGSLFKTRSSTKERKYCSRVCMAKKFTEYTRAKSIEKECPQCKKMYTTPFGTGESKFCSRACMSIAFSQKRKGIVKSNCECCHKTFEQDTYNKRYLKRFCSKQCQITTLTNKAKNKFIDKNCKTCGNTYSVNTYRVNYIKEYCSETCRSVALSKAINIRISQR